MLACHIPLSLLVHQANRVETMDAEQQGNSDQDRLALVLVELDDIGEALDRAREELEKLRRAA